MFRIRTTWTGLLGGPYVTFTFWTATTENDAAASEGCLALDQCFEAAKAQMSSPLAWAVDPTADVINPATGALTGALNGTAQSGTATGVGGFLPTHVQGGMRLFTNTILAGRRIKGHLNLPGPLLAAEGSGVPTAGYQTSWAAASANLLSPANARLSVWSRARGVAAPVAQIQIASTWFALRSRRD